MITSLCGFLGTFRYSPTSPTEQPYFICFPTTFRPLRSHTRKWSDVLWDATVVLQPIGLFPALDSLHWDANLLVPGSYPAVLSCCWIWLISPHLTCWSSPANHGTLDKSPLSLPAPHHTDQHIYLSTLSHPDDGSFSQVNEKSIMFLIVPASITHWHIIFH